MHKQEYKAYQEKLAQIRVAKGITQTKLAESLEKPQSYISKYESGEKRLDIAEFLEICRCLKIDINTVLMEENGNS